jgi:hypothetical protein
MIASPSLNESCFTPNREAPQPGYFDLKGLAIYSSCSVRWLRDRLIDRNHPLPHHRVQGKLLVKREDFDQWISHYREDRPSHSLEDVVNEVVGRIAC